MRTAQTSRAREAEVEHASAKDLIAQIQSTDASDALFDAKVKVLGVSCRRARKISPPPLTEATKEP